MYMTEKKLININRDQKNPIISKRLNWFVLTDTNIFEFIHVPEGKVNDSSIVVLINNMI